jgi:hypothetical protein
VRHVWLVNFTYRDLLARFDACLRDASLRQLSAHGRFVAARDAVVACAAIVLGFDGSRDRTLESLLFDFSEHESVRANLAREIAKLGFDSADHSIGFSLADELAAQRAYRCAVKARAVALSWLREREARSGHRMPKRPRRPRRRDDA